MICFITVCKQLDPLESNTRDKKKKVCFLGRRGAEDAQRRTKTDQSFCNLKKYISTISDQTTINI